MFRCLRIRPAVHRRRLSFDEIARRRVDCPNEAMIAAFGAGEDLHRATAAAVLGKAVADVTGEDRDLPKAVNFGFLYGQNARRFPRLAWTKFGIELTFEEAKKIRKLFFRRYQGLRQWHQAAHEEASGITEGRTLLGRRRWADPDDEEQSTELVTA